MTDEARLLTPDPLVRQRLRVARLVLELVPGAEQVASEQLAAASALLDQWKAGEPLPATQAAPARAELLARAAELERTLRDEVERRRPFGARPWVVFARRWGWAVGLAVVVSGYLGLSLRHQSFRPGDWSKEVLAGLRIDSWKQTYANLMTGTKRRGVPVLVGGKVVGPSLFVHAASEVNVTVLAEGQKLSGTCAYPDEMTGNAVVCSIRDGERILFESQTLDESNRQAPFSVAVPPTRRLTLQLQTKKEHIRMAQGVWTNLKVTR
ncbi:MAG: hypothetical protein RL199_230 [Pseudomonadota bacterium]|jgi:hypothetical protein